MSRKTSFPYELLEWAANHLSNITNVVDVSWPRENSRVWRLTSDLGAAFVKISPSSQDYDREIRGYAFAARALAPGQAPRLLAHNPNLLAIMTSPLPGQVVLRLSLKTQQEQHIHKLAGQLLQRWHDHSDAASTADRKNILAVMASYAIEAAAHLAETASYLDNEQRALVRRASQELPQLAESLPIVYRHGDYSPRNWLWDNQSGHALIDFARSDYGLAIEEFVWLYGVMWVVRPELKAAYLSGYGRALSDSEEQFLHLLTAKKGISYLHNGFTQQRSDLIERGQLVLTRLTRQRPTYFRI